MKTNIRLLIGYSRLSTGDLSQSRTVLESAPYAAMVS